MNPLTAVFQGDFSLLWANFKAGAGHLYRGGRYGLAVQHFRDGRCWDRCSGRLFYARAWACRVATSMRFGSKRPLVAPSAGRLAYAAASDLAAGRAGTRPHHRGRVEHDAGDGDAAGALFVSGVGPRQNVAAG